MTFEEMYALACQRKKDMPEGKGTTELFKKGPHGIGKKLVEEAAESWMAARFESRDAQCLELSQVLYYVAVMMAEKGLTLEEVNTLIRRIQGKLVAQTYMMIEYDCPSELLSKACEMTPGLDAPTVTKLHGREWYSVKAMVPREEANAIMDKLWDAGARSILLFGIESARI